MTSPETDTVTPGFEQAAASLLTELNKATQQLAASQEIPADVAALVDQFDSLLYARNPASGLATVDPYLAEGLLGGAVVCLKALRHDNTLVGRNDLRLGLEQVRQALRDLLDEHPIRADRPPKEVARWLVETTSVPQSDLAEVLHVAPRTFQRWVSHTDTASPAGEDEMRLGVVARLVNHLRHAFTGPGAIRWLQRPHPALDGKAPASLLDDESRYPELTSLAARARSMVAS